jgi:hypothetical protein
VSGATLALETGAQLGHRGIIDLRRLGCDPRTHVRRMASIFSGVDLELSRYFVNAHTSRHHLNGTTDAPRASSYRYPHRRPTAPQPIRQGGIHHPDGTERAATDGRAQLHRSNRITWDMPRA